MGFFYSFLFLSFSLLFICTQRKHFLMVLLGFELIVLVSFVLSLSVLSGSICSKGISFSVMLLVFGVCDSVFGLGLLVSRSRNSGLDQMGNLFYMS